MKIREIAIHENGEIFGTYKKIKTFLKTEIEESIGEMKVDVTFEYFDGEVLILRYRKKQDRNVNFCDWREFKKFLEMIDEIK